MIPAWRIDKAGRTKAAAFSGEGSRLVAGRWHSRGRAVVYAASSLSLAALEKFVHLGEDGDRIRFVSYEVRIPKAVRVVEWRLADMPSDWRAQPAPASTQKMGDRWLADHKSAVLILPSVITPSESNVLLNPAHPQFGQIGVFGPRAYSFDPRMWNKS